MLVDQFAEPVLIDIEGLTFFDVEWEFPTARRCWRSPSTICAKRSASSQAKGTLAGKRPLALGPTPMTHLLVDQAQRAQVTEESQTVTRRCSTERIVRGQWPLLPARLDFTELRQLASRAVAPFKRSSLAMNVHSRDGYIEWRISHRR